MEQYIPKSALVAELESLRCTTFTNFDEGVNATVQILLETLDTLEVKEVDLEKEINYWQGCEACPEGVGITPLPKAMEIVEKTAKHFFELGLKVAQKGEL